MLSVANSFGQGFTINGTVKDAGINDILPGVNVLVKGESRGTTTDFDGNFTLSNVEVGDVLSFSYIGFVTKEITIQNSNPLVVSMVEDVNNLDEVVVVGYGSSTKK